MDKIIEDIWVQLGGVGLFALSGWVVVYVLFKQYSATLEKYQNILVDNLEVQSSLQNKLTIFTDDIKHANDTICELSQTITDYILDAGNTGRQQLTILTEIKELATKTKIEAEKTIQEVRNLPGQKTPVPQVDELLEAIQSVLKDIKK